MDKPRIILSVAGSGKTTYIIEQLQRDTRALIVTYTDNNVEHLTQSVINKFGCIPQNVSVLSYFSFLYSFCYKPFLSLKFPSRGLTFDAPDPKNLVPSNKVGFYRRGDGYLYGNRLSLLIQNGCLQDVIGRLDKYFDYFFIDEVQDMAGYDFDFIVSLKTIKCSRLYVGDFFQHSVDSSRSGAKNKNLHSEYSRYKDWYLKAGFDVDVKTLSKTYRCGPDICDFITKKLGIPICSHKINDTSTIGLIDDPEVIRKIVEDSSIIKLLYQNSGRYNCKAMNWGASKGLNRFRDVCVVLNKTTFDYYRKGNMKSLAPVTRNKLYVAITRAHGNVYLVKESDISEYRINKK